MRKVKKKKKYQQLTHFFNKKLYIHNDELYTYIMINYIHNDEQ